MKKQTFLFVASLLLAYSVGYAQDSTQSEKNQQILSAIPGNTKMVITGTAYFGFQSLLNNTSSTDVKKNFNSYGFNPVFLFKLSDKMLLESEIEIQDGEFALEFAKLSYSLNKYMNVGAGLMLTPFGAYGERWESSFIEKFPNTPIRARGPYIPGGNHLNWGGVMGVDVRGGIPLGSAKMNYILFLTNGPTLDASAGTGGMLQYENASDNNNNKEIGGRIGLLPLSNSSLEIGFSAKHGIAGNQGDPVYGNTAATAYAFDYSYVKAIEALKSTINIRGQINSVTVDKVNYPLSETTSYTFDNTLKHSFAQISLRPTMAQGKFLKKTEFLFRYNGLTAPKDAVWGAKDKNGKGGKINRTDIGLAYWFNWKAGLRLAYETTAWPDGTKNEEFLARIVYGF